MKIFETEKNLEKVIAANKSAAMLVPVKLTEEKTDLLIKSLENIKSRTVANKAADRKFSEALSKIAEIEHPDLMYGSAILVSTVMNKNDDVFLPNETWAARLTPINTPYNNDHVEFDIIGHIIAATTLDKEGNVIDGTEPPEYFDIEVDFVVYKSIFPEVAQDIYENAPLGKRFVSMEARFDDFDYAIVKGSKVELISRNEQTAFLTKYLRAYGGEGFYKEDRIGRVLRNFRFVGMGNVAVPANPASEYTKLENFELAAANKIVDDSKTILVINIKGKTMKVESLEKAEEVIAQLQAQIQNYETEKTQGEAAKKVESLENEKKSLTDQLNATSTKLEATEKSLKDATDKVTSTEAELAKIQAELKTKADELAKRDAEVKAAQRFEQLKTLGHEVAEDKKDNIKNMSDEAFASVIEYVKTLHANKEEKSETSEIADAEKEAQAKLEAAKAKDGKGVEDSVGEQETEAQRTQKTAEKVAAKLRDYRKRDLKSKKEKI
jgi:hypothetical protein